MSEPAPAYTVELTTAAAREIKKLPRAARERVLDAVDDLADDPRPHGSRKLAGREAWRIRIGDYRVIYEITDSELLVTVIRAANRREVYKK